MASASITVGEAARRAGVSPKAVRLYEAKGILPPAERTQSGYRTYSEQDVEVLRFVRRARALGLRLEEIGRILDLQREGAQPCGTVVELLEGHLREIDRTMRELRALRRDLASALDVAKSSAERGDEVVVCPIIESPASSRLRS
ncbi:MAG: heavy metal-responsive transcriptional regulator [Actinomycetota bacterium]|jgi:MerR family transcriptional regulator, copper efflux regulator